jgi:PEP-CTERM motif
MKGINVLGLGATFAAVAGAITLSSSSAQAFTFTPKDHLSGTASFQIEKAGNLGVKDGNGSFFNFGDLSLAKGQRYSTLTGTFAVEEGSTGNFEGYNTDGDKTDNSYIIRDFDFASVPLSITDFLSYDDGAGGQDEWSIDWNNIKVDKDITKEENGIKFRDITLSGEALFKSGNKVSGAGSFATTIRIDRATGNATLEFGVKAVPEPASVLGLLAVGVLGAGSLKRKKSS